MLFKAAALATSPSPDLLASFYLHLTQHNPSFSAEDSGYRLSIQFRDVCLRLLTLVGAPQMLSALMPLAKAEGDVESKSARSSLNEK